MSGPIDAQFEKKESPEPGTADGLEYERMPGGTTAKSDAAKVKPVSNTLSQEPSIAEVLNRLKGYATPDTSALVSMTASTSMARMQKNFLGTEPERVTFHVNDKFSIGSSAIDSRILLPTAALTGGLSAYSLVSDLEQVTNAKSFRQELVYGVASGFDAVALAGSSLSILPTTRRFAPPLMAVGSFGRLTTRLFE
ncbi:MAG TPA: hypothetical protein V6C76_06315 [Drouetiella sp.]